MKTFLGVCLLVFVLAADAGAVVIRYQVRGTITNSDFPAQIAVGDPYIIDFAYEETTPDSDYRPSFGTFAGAILSFNFRLGPRGQLGNYPAAMGTTFWPINTGSGNGPYPTGLPDRFYVSVTGGTFTPLGGYAFGGLLFVLDDYTDRANIWDIGGGQMLGETLGGTLQLGYYSNRTMRIMAVDKHGKVEGSVASVEVIGEGRLEISAPDPGHARITWEHDNYWPYVLESTANIPATNWTTVTNSVTLVGNRNTVTVETGEARRFFRLRPW